jgi:hypothetical protein
MFGRKKKKKEPLPWYRARKYKGNLTEDEKRELDSFRHREKAQAIKHPAATYDDLPEGDGSYISKIQIEQYDQIQERLVGRCFLVSGIGAFVLLNHFGWISPNYHSTEMLLWAALLFIAPWIYYAIKFRKNADQFWDDAREGIRMEWELDYIVGKKAKKQTGQLAEHRLTAPVAAPAQI